MTSHDYNPEYTRLQLDKRTEPSDANTLMDAGLCPHCGEESYSSNHFIQHTLGRGRDGRAIVCGNSPSQPKTEVIEQRHPTVKLDLTEEEISAACFRANTTQLCDACGREYGEHPLVDDYFDWEGRLFLYFLCSGEIVKL